MKETKKDIDITTEERIKLAAHTVFQQKGFAATRTRDIAEEAGINLALLNYYFRSKERLFEIVMFETLADFISGVEKICSNEETTFEEKIELLADRYIDIGITDPDIPMFIISELRNEPDYFLEKSVVKGLSKSCFAAQFYEKVEEGKIDESKLVHFLVNLLSMLIMPIIGRSFVRDIWDMDDKEYTEFMNERKKLIPIWIKQMFFIQKNCNE